MPPAKADTAYLWDMLDAARAVAEFVSGRTFADYEGSRLLRGAVERHVEIVGEAARHVSDVFREAHPLIPWRLIVAQRHVLAHDYGEIKHERIWRVATVHHPELIRLLEPLVPEPESDPDEPEE
ncbi:MAG: HepT-like ribonuclease domain-containing protein [Planctomycetaceae bacterium]